MVGEERIWCVKLYGKEIKRAHKRERALFSSKSLPSETINMVHTFYASDEISHIMPGKKDFASVKIEGKHACARLEATGSQQLVLSNLRGEYHKFKEKFPDRNWVSIFAELRPKHCILAGASGTHLVGVCTIQQNVKLMMCVIQLSDLPTYHHCLARTICNSTLHKCYLGECDVCPSVATLQEHLITFLDEKDVDQIIYN